MAYRTKTYIAADWDGDNDAVKQLYKWKRSNYWSLDFHDAHDLTQARDSSLNCSIKVVLYNASSIDKSKCPDAVKNIGTHKAMRYIYYENGQRYWDWDYQTVKSALGQ